MTHLNASGAGFGGWIGGNGSRADEREAVEVEADRELAPARDVRGGSAHHHDGQPVPVVDEREHVMRARPVCGGGLGAMVFGAVLVARRTARAAQWQCGSRRWRPSPRRA